MSGNARVLTGLMERRALEAAFSELADIKSPTLQIERAQEIARQGGAALHVLLTFLDTSDPQLRGGLGQVAARLPREEVVPALLHVTRSREQSEQARLTALTILDRFLHESVDETLLGGLANPSALAQQSLREVLHEMARNPFSVIEYLNQLAEQPPEVARMILSAIPSMPASPDLVTLLRMLAQGEDAFLAQGALEQLGRMRTVDAGLALSSLAATLPPQRAQLAERGLRKLRLGGVSPPNTDTEGSSLGWRALISPLNGEGYQVIWFVGRSSLRDHGTLFSVLTHDPEGIVGSFGSAEVPVDALPPQQPLGTLQAVAQSADMPPITFLEVTFGAGRQAVREALELNWRGGSPAPPEYRLLNPLIWSTRFSPEAGLPAAIPPAREYTPADTIKVLHHPAFAGWFWQGPALIEAARELGPQPSQEARRASVMKLASSEFTPEVVASYQRRLRAMARWLALASQPEMAARAQALADQLGTVEPADSPFVRHVVGLGLDIVIVNLHLKNLI
jgi:hypothetical protein